MIKQIELYVPLTIVLLVALTFHEFAHAWTAYKLGDDTAYKEGRVTLNPLVHLDLMGTLCFIVTQGFGWAKPVPVIPSRLNNPRRDDILVSFAGPFSNFLIAIIAALIYRICVAQGIFADLTIPSIKLLHHVLKLMVYANLILTLFNLIPIFPLDGSHIAKNMLPLNQAFRYQQFNQTYGMWMLIGLVMMGRITNGVFDPLRWLITNPVNYLFKLLVVIPWN